MQSQAVSGLGSKNDLIKKSSIMRKYDAPNSTMGCQRASHTTMSSINSQIESRILRVRERIEQAEIRYGRVPGSVSLLAVSKTHPLDKVKAALQCGQTQFGESYVQDALVKITALPNLQWHFIGPLQSNKCKQIAHYFSWVHSLAREKTALLLSQHRQSTETSLQVCLQVNISGESAKSGVAISEAEALAHSVSSLPGLTLRGLMTIPPFQASESECRRQFAELRRLLETLQRQYASMDTLSMGMSRDLEWAISEGATIVRVGTDIFGQRET